nr:FG-GAP repeat protein [Pirellulales bacterium]
MKRLNRNDRRYASAPAKRRRLNVGSHRRGEARTLGFEPLEDRRLLAVDFGDAPDTGPGTGPGNYITLSTDDGARHTIVVGLKLGANVDGDGGALQNTTANADDVNGALPDDEDGLTSPAADLVLTVSAQPTVSVRATNSTGAAATLYGWIDYDRDGVFENATERATMGVPNGTNNGIVTLTFPAVPAGAEGTTYARFRLSTDGAAADAIGVAADGEVEDYRVSITRPSSGLVDSSKTKKIASGLNGGPTLANSDYLGRAVAAIGDIDGDGVTDLAVGANGDDTGGSSRGAVRVLFMNPDGSVRNSVKIAQNTGNFFRSLANGDYFGGSLAALGDLDGDGVPDLAVGAERDERYSRPSNSGGVHVLFLNANGTVKDSGIIAGNVSGGPSLSTSDYFGRSLTSLGDLDGDGVTDLAVGAYGDDTGGSDRGAIHVLFMNSNGTVKSQQKIASGIGGGPSLANSDKFGSSVTSLGDMDGDGIADLAVGAVNDDTGGFNRGAVHVLFMNSNGTVKSSQKIASGAGGGPTLVNGDQFGTSVAATGDLDGDGVTDLAVGSYYDDTGGTSRGAVHVLFMNANGTVKASHKIANGTNGGPTLANDDRFGVSVTSMGDLDGDGLTDLAVGANFDDTGGINRGAVYVLFMNAIIINTNPVFTSTPTAAVPENTTVVKTVTATDADLPAQPVTFSLTGGVDQARFSITAGGVLS